MASSDETGSKTAHWETVRRIFHLARELRPDARSGYLDQACLGDLGLRREVVLMLAADAAAPQGFLQEPVISLPSRELHSGRRVGPFRVVSKLGAGNMGEVYLARRIAFRQEVALKLIDSNKIDSESLRRFGHERQILAKLTHPNIACLIDGGTLEDGRPWFALEYIEGERIDNYCDSKQLDLRQRVQIFRRVCAAVHEAHSLAIVHRDLKPANILVTDDGEPKLLDFGIAKILATTTSEDPAPTLFRWGLESTDSIPTDGTSHPMTPLYASPEQAEPLLLGHEEGHAPRPIGVRSDVYSLGVVLYELLTGHPVYRCTQPWFKVLEAVGNEEPRLPSEVVMTKREVGGRRLRQLTPLSVSTSRNCTPAKLRKQLLGDLDAILNKALAKNPELRYASVDRMADDLGAYLEGRPIEARSQNQAYRVRKLAQRLWAPLVLALAILGSSYLLLEERAQRKLDEAVELLEQTEEDLAELSAEIQRGLRGDALDESLAEIVANQDDPIWLAHRFESLGLDSEDRGHFAAAERLCAAAVAVHEAEHGPDHLGLPPFLNSYAGALGFVGRYEEAEQLYLRALEIYDRGLGPLSYESSRTLNNLAALYQIWNSNFPKARPLLEQSLEIRRKQHRDAAPQVLAVRNNLAYQNLLEGHYEQARSGFLEVLADLERTMSPGGEDVFRQRMARIIQHLATIDLELGNPQEAARKSRRALAILREELLHWRIAEAETVYGASLAGLGRHQEARFFLDQGLEIVRQVKGVHSTNTRDARLRYDRWVGDGPIQTQ